MAYYVIRNKLTGGIIHQSLFKLKTFKTWERANNYIVKRRLNPDFFEVAKITTGGGAYD